MRAQQIRARSELAKRELAETIAHRESAARSKGGDDDAVERLSVVVKDDAGNRSRGRARDLRDAGERSGLLRGRNSRLQPRDAHD